MGRHCSVASAIMMRESPTWSSVCMMLPSGRSMGATVVFASNTFSRKAMVPGSPETMRYGVIV